MSIIKTCVFNTAPYACETLTLKETDKGKILPLKIYCYRRILHLSWIHKVSNRQIRKRLSIKEVLVQIIMFKLSLNMSEVMMGVIEENQRRGTPCRQLPDDIGE